MLNLGSHQYQFDEKMLLEFKNNFKDITTNFSSHYWPSVLIFKILPISTILEGRILTSFIGLLAPIFFFLLIFKITSEKIASFLTALTYGINKVLLKHIRFFMVDWSTVLLAPVLIYLLLIWKEKKETKYLILLSSLMAIGILNQGAIVFLSLSIFVYITYIFIKEKELPKKDYLIFFIIFALIVSPVILRLGEIFLVNSNQFAIQNNLQGDYKRFGVNYEGATLINLLNPVIFLKHLSRNFFSQKTSIFFMFSILIIPFIYIIRLKDDVTFRTLILIYSTQIFIILISIFPLYDPRGIFFMYIAVLGYIFSKSKNILDYVNMAIIYLILLLPNLISSLEYIMP